MHAIDNINPCTESTLHYGLPFFVTHFYQLCIECRIFVMTVFTTDTQYFTLTKAMKNLAS